MTIYLRTSENKTVVDIELNFATMSTDLQVAINIKEYSKILQEYFINHSDRETDQLVKDFSELSELRGWFWENYMEYSENPNAKECKQEIKELFLTPIQEKYNLYYVED